MLIDFIGNKLPNFQVVATTHSPLTAQQADTGELFALKRNDNNVVTLIPFIGSPKSLLVNQLLMTPVFGLETDESYEVQQAKEDYEILKSKGNQLNIDDLEKMKLVKQKLKTKLPKRTSPESSKKEIDLLERIETKLNIKK